MNELYLKQLIKGIREKSSLIVFLIGFLLVIFFAFHLLVSALLNKNSFGKISQEAAHTKVDFQDSSDFNKTEENELTIYTVLKGDSSWKIASKLLGDGKRYPEIEELNKLEHNQLLEIGQILFVDIGEKVGTDAGNKITLNQGRDKTSTCTIKAGDSLWNIALENYSDPMVWREIYETNKEVLGSNPDLIFPFTQIELPNIL